MYTQWQLFLFICKERKQVSCLLMATPYKIITKGHLLQFRLGTLHLAKGARHPEENLIDHLFSELVFELSHISLITFC